MELELRELQSAAGGTLIQYAPEFVLRRISIDSRVIKEDTLFVPIIGEKSDGHLYLEKAAENGAKAVLTSSEEAARCLRGKDVAVILVRDTVEALQAIGKAARAKRPIPAVGVTGSVGKTTTREMIYRALSGGLNAYKTGKNYNNRLGVPLTLSEIPEEAEIAVLELGMNVPGELGTISSLTDIDTAVITNIGTAHMEYYGNQEGIAREKFTVTRGFSGTNPREKRLFLNGDDPYLARYREFTAYPVTTFGFGAKNEYSARNFRSESGTYVFDLFVRGKEAMEVRLSALGKHNIPNALAAFAVADHYGVRRERAAEELSKFTGFKGRLERKECRGALVIDDTYNASPASMTAGLQVVSEVCFGTGRKVAVLGDMLELGEDTEALHSGVGKASAGFGIDEYLLVGPLAARIGAGLKEAGSTAKIREFQDNAAALEHLRKTFSPGTLYYFKASHGMNFGGLAEEFTDHE